MRKGLALIVWLGLLSATAAGQEPAHKNPKLSIDQRLNDLVAKMTLEE